MYFISSPGNTQTNIASIYHQLVDIYSKVILSKVELEGKSRQSKEIFNVKTFEKYLGYIQACWFIEQNFYNEHRNGKDITNI